MICFYAIRLYYQDKHLTCVNKYIRISQQEPQLRVDVPTLSKCIDCTRESDLKPGRLFCIWYPNY